MREVLKMVKISPRLSFKGYKLSEALYRNKDSVKGILAILGGINIAIGLEWRTFWISLGAGVFALVVKLIADAVDYYFSEVEL